MAAMNQKRFKTVPPDKGSFPLDHDNICKDLMKKYMICLSANKNKSSFCRIEMRDYLDCRMNNELMARESWRKLGFTEKELSSTTKIES